jgi:hypothetical protein
MSFRKLLTGFVVLIAFVFFLSQTATSGAYLNSYPTKQSAEEPAKKSKLDQVNKTINSVGKNIQ